MKKLKLTAFQLGNTEILTRQQLRNVLGGDVGSSTTTTTTKLTTAFDCSMYSCLGFACSTNTNPLHAWKCTCVDGGECSTSHPNG